MPKELPLRAELTLTTGITNLVNLLKRLHPPQIKPTKSESPTLAMATLRAGNMRVQIMYIGEIGIMGHTE